MLYKKHLLGGVAKGAFDETAAEQKFQDWLVEKTSKIEAKVSGIAKAKSDAEAKAFEAEVAVNKARKESQVATENAAIKAEADAKDAAAAAKKATEAATAEEVKPETIDDAAAAAASEGEA